MTETVPEPTATERRPAADLAGRRWPTRYDVVLALVPLAFGLALLAGALLEVGLPTALAVASTLCLGAIVDTVYRNPPASTQ